MYRKTKKQSGQWNVLNTVLLKFNLQNNLDSLSNQHKYVTRNSNLRSRRCLNSAGVVVGIGKVSLVIATPYATA